MENKLIEFINDILDSRKFGTGDDFYMSDDEKEDLKEIIEGRQK